MIRDPDLLDALSGIPRESFATNVFRATRSGLDPLAPSMAGGRWMLPGTAAVLYTSTDANGALAEIAYHLSMLTPLPSKPIALHTIRLETQQTLRLSLAHLDVL